jgi:hypothetical protein
MKKRVIEFPDIPGTGIGIIHGIDDPDQFMVPRVKKNGIKSIQIHSCQKKPEKERAPENDALMFVHGW